MGGAGAGGPGGSGGGDALCFDYTSFKPSQVSFKTDVLPIFRISCTFSGATCHADPKNTAQPFLASENDGSTMTQQQIDQVIAGIVDVQAKLEPDMKIVDPGHPEKSFMTYKLDASPQDMFCPNLACTKAEVDGGMPCGTSMPQGMPERLPASQRAIVRSWIALGAKND